MGILPWKFERVAWKLKRSQFLFPDPTFLYLSFWEAPYPWCQR